MRKLRCVLGCQCGRCPLRRLWLELRGRGILMSLGLLHLKLLLYPLSATFSSSSFSLPLALGNHQGSRRAAADAAAA